MVKQLKSLLLVSAAAMVTVTALPLAGPFAPTSASLFSASALADRGRDSDDDHDDGDHGNDHDRGDDHDRNDDHGGRGGDDDRNDDRGGKGDDDRDHSSRGHSDDPDEVRLSPTPEQLRGLSDGSLIATDSLGRRLEIEIEREHGRVEVKGELSDYDARTKPGAITDVEYSPAALRR